MASTYLSRTFGTPTNSKKWTISFWMKRAMENNWDAIFGCDYDQGDSYYGVGSGGQAKHEIGLLEYHTSATDYGQGYTTNASLRDCSAWYHIVFAYDSTQSTAADRGKTYINGVFASSTYSANIPQNHDSKFNSNGVGMRIGCRSAGGGSAFFEGSLSHFHFIDGTAYDATPFGSTDSTTGEWKINTSPSVTYGNNGFFVLKDGNSGTDQSGNGNNWTVGGGTLTNTEDCPSNVFCTMNPLSKGSNISTSNGNTTISSSGSDNSILGTIACGSGKYYWEAKCTATGTYANLGVTRSSKYGGNHSDVDSGRVVYGENGYVYREGLSGQGNTSGLATFAVNDIISVAFDTENGTLSFYKNNTLVNTTTDNELLFSNNEFIPCSGLNSGGFSYNFGNGYFGTTAVTSAGTNASGIGIFEYDVPTGYTALSTKGLNL